MTLDDLISAEIAVYNERWQDYKADETDELARVLAVESERILKQFYRLKFNEEPNDNPLRFIRFMNT